jgi:hypothetical protein
MLGMLETVESISDSLGYNHLNVTAHVSQNTPSYQPNPPPSSVGAPHTLETAASLHESEKHLLLSYPPLAGISEQGLRDWEGGHNTG